MSTSSTVTVLRGLLIMGAGMLVLLHTLGYLQEFFSIMLSALAVIAILYGFFSSGLYHTLKSMVLNKKR